MFFGSTSTNINALTIIMAVSIVVGIGYSFTITSSDILLALVSFYVLNLLGVWLTMHRYYSHRSFEFKFTWMKWIFTGLAVLAGRGSPLGWAYLHRKHHAYADTIDDPHSPKYLGFKLVGFGHLKRQERDGSPIFRVKDWMSPVQLFIHKWYMLIVSPILIAFAMYDFHLFCVIWAIPALLIQLSQGIFNYFGHVAGYRNFDTADESRNNPWLFPILLGEAWHNNHHAFPKLISTAHVGFEYDPMSYLIGLLKK